MTATFNPSAFSCVILGDQSLTIACADMIVAGGHHVLAVVTTDADVRGWAEGKGIATYAKPADLNFHDGPLPRYAGLNTPAWAIINGETQHGVSWHMIEGGVDEGDLLAQEMIDIAGDETAFSLNSKCYAAGMESFSRVMAQLESGTPERTSQDLSQRSYFARDQRPAVLGLIDFSQTTAQITALLRGLDFAGYWNPLGLAKIAIGDAVYTVSGAKAAAGSGAVGTVLESAADRLVVATSDGAVSLSGIAALGGDELPATGAVLDTVSDDMRIAHDALLKDETYWRAKLARMEALPLPLAMGAASGTWTERRIDAPQGAQAAASAFVSAMALGAGQAGDVGVAVTPALSSYAADWVPLRSDTDIATQIERIVTTAGFATDLPLRDANITAQKPQIMLADARKPTIPPTLFTAVSSGRLRRHQLRVPWCLKIKS